MQAIKRFIGRLFSSNLLLSTLKNDVAHMLISFEEANARVKEAFDYAQKVKEFEAEEFATLKAHTLWRTEALTNELIDSVKEETEYFEQKYNVGRRLLGEKMNIAQSLFNKIRELKFTDHNI